MSRRTEMLGSTIQREIAEMIMRELDDPRVPSIVSVTRVRIAPDLSIADVFVTVMGTVGQQTAALNALKHSAGMMRTKLTRTLSLRQSPFLKFHLDDKLKKELEMMELLHKVAQENAEADRRRARAAQPGSPDVAGTDDGMDDGADAVADNMAADGVAASAVANDVNAPDEPKTDEDAKGH